MMAGNTWNANFVVRAARQHPLLAPEEEQELARRFEAGDEQAMDRLVTSHLRFVIRIARAYKGWGLPMNDLIQEGTVGLVQAVHRFNPDRGVRLSTYAVWWIRAAIQDYVLRSLSMVRIGTTNAQKALALRLRQFLGDLDGEDGNCREDIAERLAKHFDSTVAEVIALARRMARRDASLDWTGDEDRSRIDRLASEAPTPEQVVAQVRDHRALRAALAAALSRLPHREQLVIRRRYFDDVRQTFAAIGKELGVSKDRVRQLEARAIGKLQDLLRPVLSDDPTIYEFGPGWGHR